MVRGGKHNTGYVGSNPGYTIPYPTLPSFDKLNGRALKRRATAPALDVDIWTSS